TRGSEERASRNNSGLPPEYTEFANRMARRIRNLDSAEIGRLSALLENGGKGDGKAS
ncbi:transcriptional regulator, partial [Rhizobium johnstonii]